MTFTIDGKPVVASDATSALRSVARNAKRGSEFRDEHGTLLAVYERIEHDDGFMLAWQRTEAWRAGGQGT